MASRRFPARVATGLAVGLAGGDWFFAVDGECSLISLVPAALRGASGLARLGVSPRVVTGLAVAVAVASLAAGALNWRLFIQPGLDPAASQYHRIADMVAANTRPQDRIIVNGLERTRLKIDVLYHAKRAAIIPEFLFGPQRAEDDSVRALEVARTADGGLYLLDCPPSAEPWGSVSALFG